MSVLPLEIIKFVSGFKNVDDNKLSVIEPAVITSCFNASPSFKSVVEAFESNELCKFNTFDIDKSPSFIKSCFKSKPSFNCVVDALESNELCKFNTFDIDKSSSFIKSCFNAKPSVN